MGHSHILDILVFSSLYFCLPLPFSCSSSSFLLPLFLFKNGQNARDIRQFCSPLPPESPKTLNLTKTMVFYSKSWPPGSKTHAFLILFEGSPRGPQEAPKRPSRGTQDERPSGGPQEAQETRSDAKIVGCLTRFCRFCPPHFSLSSTMVFAHFEKRGSPVLTKTAKTRETSDNFGI